MITKPKNWENVKAFSERRKLPVGAYVCRIKQAVVKTERYGTQLCLLFDIEDGEFSGYYSDDFDRNQNTDKKWKGVLRYFIPTDDGSEQDEWTKSRFKGLITAIEESNRGYIFDWDERSLKGRVLGIVFRNEEWEYDGKTGWTARPFLAISADNVADGTFTIPKDKPLKNKSGAPTLGFPAPATPDNSGFSELPDYNDSDLPF